MKNNDLKYIFNQTIFERARENEKRTHKINENQMNTLHVWNGHLKDIYAIWVFEMFYRFNVIFFFFFFELPVAMYMQKNHNFCFNDWQRHTMKYGRLFEASTVSLKKTEKNCLQTSSSFRRHIW